MRSVTRRSACAIVSGRRRVRHSASASWPRPHARSQAVAAVAEAPRASPAPPARRVYPMATGSRLNIIRFVVAKPGPFAFEAHQRLHEQAGGDEQDQRKSDLPGDQQLARADATAARRIRSLRHRRTRGADISTGTEEPGRRRQPVTSVVASVNISTRRSNRRVTFAPRGTNERRTPATSGAGRHAERAAASGNQGALNEQLAGHAAARRARAPYASRVHASV